MSGTTPEALIGRRIAGKYEVVAIIGQGAMGIVYEARQVALDKVVALKVLAHSLRDAPEFVARFHTEARAASRLDHPNSARVLDFGEEPDGLLYFVMEMLHGRSLACVIEDEFPLPAVRVARIMSQVLSAVGGAHKLGILHRDLKPENIMILEGRDEEDQHIDVVKVCDFGIAKLDGGVEAEPAANAGEAGSKPVASKATRAGAIVGTPQYMSPEQARGEVLDVRSDLYSLGVVLFELLTQRPPFDQATPGEVLYAHAHVPAPSPIALRPDADPQLTAICMRALSKRKEERFGSAREMRTELRALANSGSDVRIEQPSGPRVRNFDASAPTIEATVSSSLPVAPNKPRSRRAPWIGLVAIVVGVGGAAVVIPRLARQQSAAAAVVGTSAAPLASSVVLAARDRVARAEPGPGPSDDVASQEAIRSDPPSPQQPVVLHRTTPHGTSTRPDPLDVPAPLSESATPVNPSNVATATAATTAATTAPPPPTSLPVRSVDPSLARVELGAIRPERITAASVEGALRHLDFTGCYRSALAAPSQSPFAGTGTLAIETDEDGNIVRSSLTGLDLPASLQQCIVGKANRAHIANVDTGAAAAKVTLRFVLQ